MIEAHGIDWSAAGRLIVHGVDCEIVSHPRTGRPVVTLDDASL